MTMPDDRSRIVGRRPDGIKRAKMVVVETPSEGKPTMGKSVAELSSATRVGLDLAKNVFQDHAVDAKGAVVVARAIKRKGLLKFFEHYGDMIHIARSLDPCCVAPWSVFPALSFPIFPIM